MPRALDGMNSAIRAPAAGMSAPMASPMTKRSAMSCQPACAERKANEPTTKRIIVAKKTTRRP